MKQQHIKPKFRIGDIVTNKSEHAPIKEEWTRVIGKIEAIHIFSYGRIGYTVSGFDPKIKWDEENFEIAFY